MTAYTYEHKYRLAQQFARRWKNEKREEAEAKTFWDEFFRIFNLDRYKTASLEYAVKHHRQKTTKFADVFWAGRLLCEHKSANKDLDKAFAQAASYVDEIRRHNPHDVPRYIIVCDFATMRLYDLHADTHLGFALEELPEQIKNRNFDFMDGIGRDLKAAEEQANIEAADAVGSLYQAFRADTAYNEHALKQFIIRLLFCFFADDTLIFDKNQFEDYLRRHTKDDGSDTGSTLNQIFQALDTPPDKRPVRMNSELKAFPYVNGNLFADAPEELYFDAQLRTNLLECARRDWAKISPEIFGSLFQSVMDGSERRAAGAHYTEEVNILKVINSLFMDKLRTSFDSACKIRGKRERKKAIDDLHQQIASLSFLDPACGCGNFLVIAYRELRRLEDEIIGELFAENQLLDIATMQRIHISQFYGIELDEYPAQIAKVAMWLTDHQCNLATAARFGTTRPTIPLTDSAEIINTNALRSEWPQADYIFGNPPFIGHQLRNAAQQTDVEAVFPPNGKFGKMDYVAAWYVKAAERMAAQPHIQTAFVSTNSICQGEQAGILWAWLFAQGFKIRFAHRTFQWTSAAKGKAAVHCVIVGFDLLPDNAPRLLFDYPDIQGQPEPHRVANINQYLAADASVIVSSRSNPPAGMAKMTKGSQPTDGGHLLLGATDRQTLLAAHSDLAPFVKPFIGADELIKGKQRWCLWFAQSSASERARFLKYPEIKARIEGVKAARQKSPTPSVREQANEPFFFTQNRQPQSNFLAVPRVSSEKFLYVPMDFFTPDSIISDAVCAIVNADLYLFGVLNSEMHMDWMRTVAGRLESRHRYSPNVYHSFPFPQADEKQRETIARLAQKILNERTAEREQDHATTLDALYDPDTMPAALKKAHRALDKAVEKLYRTQAFSGDDERIGFLFDLYQARQVETKNGKKNTSQKTVH